MPVLYPTDRASLERDCDMTFLSGPAPAGRTAIRWRLACASCIAPLA